MRGDSIEIIAAEPGEMLSVEPILLEIGPLLWQQKHPLLRKQLQRMIKRLTLRSMAMEKSSDPAVREKLQALSG